MSVSMWVTLKHAAVLHPCLLLCLSVWLSSLSVQSVQIELAGYDAAGILISSYLHGDNGRSWEAISLLFFLISPPWTPWFLFLVIPSASESLPAAPTPPPSLCFWGDGCLKSRGYKGSEWEPHLQLTGLNAAGLNLSFRALLIMNSTHSTTYTNGSYQVKASIPDRTHSQK